MSNLKKLLLYAIVPAIIAGSFSIAPKLYDIVTEPNAKLTFSVTRGPELESGGQYRRITSVRVVNSGKKALHHVQSEFNLPLGNFESFRLQESSGLRPNIKESKTAISVEINTLHPREDFTMVAMELIPDLKTVAKFHLRSDEVLGSHEVAPEKNKYLDIFGALLSGMSVFLMVVILSRKRSFLFRPEREDNIFYLLMRLGITEITEKIKFSSAPLTYLRSADILLELGSRGDEETREKCIKALKCLLLIGNIAPSSLNVIEGNIQRLSGNSYSPDEIKAIKKHATSIFKASSIREKIDNYITNPEPFTSTRT